MQPLPHACELVGGISSVLSLTTNTLAGNARACELVDGISSVLSLTVNTLAVLPRQPVLPLPANALAVPPQQQVLPRRPALPLLNVCDLVDGTSSVHFPVAITLSILSRQPVRPLHSIRSHDDTTCPSAPLSSTFGIGHRHSFHWHSAFGIRHSAFAFAFAITIDFANVSSSSSSPSSSTSSSPSLSSSSSPAPSHHSLPIHTQSAAALSYSQLYVANPSPRTLHVPGRACANWLWQACTVPCLSPCTI